MGTTSVALRDDLASLLHQLNRPLEASVHEGLVLDLYRRGDISSGKAAELLGMPLREFIPYAVKLGIPFCDITPEELDPQLRNLQSV